MTSTGTAPDLFGAAFLACAVEAVAATTIVLTAGTVWDSRSAGLGACAALAVLVAGGLTSLLFVQVLKQPAHASSRLNVRIPRSLRRAIGEVWDLFVDDNALASVAVLVLFAIRIKRRVLQRDPDVDVADSYSLDADMVPVTTSDDVGPSRAKAVPV
jgi:hypothetical protein